MLVSTSHTHKHARTHHKYANLASIAPKGLLLRCYFYFDTVMFSLSVRRFLNRLLGMPVRMQNTIFQHYTAILDENVKAAKAANR